jgi:hypothetical protein
MQSMLAEHQAEWRRRKTMNNPDVTDKQQASAASTPALGSAAPLGNHCIIRKGDQYLCGTGEWRDVPEKWFGRRYNVKSGHEIRRYKQNTKLTSGGEKGN